jgi:hypothetical protein
MGCGRRVLCLVGMVTLITAGIDQVAVAALPAPQDERPLPPPVQVQPEPDARLGDPTFTALPGAHADFGRLGGAVYQIEVPAHWNRRLVLFMHGFGELRPEADVSPPDFRAYLIGQGFAWGASSFSSTSLIPGRAADETAALWDYFARTYGRPTRTYVTGQSMGGMATNITAERYANRFDGALALCGSAGQTSAVSADADFFVAGAYAAGVTQADYDTSSGIGTLIRDRILPALRDPQIHRRFENIMIDLTGGPRAFARDGFRLEEDTNWQRAEWLVAAHLAPNQDTRYRFGPRAGVTSDEFNRKVIRLHTDDQQLRDFVAGNETTGRLAMPLLTLHSTGDGQVPIQEARILQRRVDAAGRHNRLVQRVLRDASHCGFTTTEKEAGLEALIAWVEHGQRPSGDNVLSDLRAPRPSFELNPRPGTRAAHNVPGAGQRVVLRGTLTLDGAPFDAKYLGAVVERNGLITPCQYTLSSVTNGKYEITVLADAESSGCGAPGASMLLWTSTQNARLYSSQATPWPRNHHATFDATFSAATPRGAVPPISEFTGTVSRRNGHELPAGTRIDAYVGDTRCGVASTRRTGNYSGYILNVIGPSVPGCEPDAALTFKINGRPAPNTATNDLRDGRTLNLTLP